MGPDDSYLLQYTKNTGIFWADQHSLSLGAVFKASDGHSAASMPNRLLPEVRACSHILRTFLRFVAMLDGKHYCAGLF